MKAFYCDLCGDPADLNETGPTTLKLVLTHVDDGFEQEMEKNTASFEICEKCDHGLRDKATGVRLNVGLRRLKESNPDAKFVER